MGFGLLSTLFARHRRRRVRAMMRGYRRLRVSGNLGRIEDHIHNLETTEILGPNQTCSRYIFGSDLSLPEYTIRQYLMIRLGGLGLKGALLAQVSDPVRPLVYPLPAEWRKTLQENGVRVANFRCALLFWGWLGLVTGYGVLRGAKCLLVSVRFLVSQRHVDRRNFASFQGLVHANLPSSSSENERNILAWYAQSDQRPSHIRGIGHNVSGAPEITIDNVRIVGFGDIPTMLTTPMGYVKFSIWLLGLFPKVLIDSLLGRWTTALFVPEAVLRQLIVCCTEEMVSGEYLFHNSGWLYRPLWTYSAEVKGARITMYF